MLKTWPIPACGMAGLHKHPLVPHLFPCRMVKPNRALREMPECSRAQNGTSACANKALTSLGIFVKGRVTAEMCDIWARLIFPWIAEYLGFLLRSQWENTE